MALSSGPNEALTSNEFASTFSSRILSQPSRFHRFFSTLSPSGTHFTTSTPLMNGDLRSVVTPTSHPSTIGELKRAMEDMIYAPLTAVPWGASVASGPLASSVVLSASRIRSALSSGRATETLVLLKASHALGDGASLGAVLGELADEAPDLRERVKKEMKKRRGGRRRRSLLERVVGHLKKLIWMVRGIAMIAKQQFRMLCFNNRNPFTPLLQTSLPPGSQRRSLGWTSSISLSDALLTSRSLGCSLNDLFVACISKAVDRQIRAHADSGAIPCDQERGGRVRCVIPVHLYGGILLPGQGIGNRIGAVSAEIEEKLKIIKDAPSALVSYGLAKIVSSLPPPLARRLLNLAISGSCVAISNVRGPPSSLHVLGRTVEQVVGFVPPPPTVPIGVAVMSYDGTITLTVNGDRRCVPDAELFLAWVLEEYGKLALVSLS
ncbi:hypothetical protein TrRE_jg2708 [Triparma retinervis]|uniref:O-acyltransferase WSD1 C-terminal domain-containing protein n=1 Tax=Triparma retinervis TaxID=2557542 RepID=A0A9W6ZUQ6_9STRA|nr:hypothetical protein TrRE_jg2708 [Triparma retinervis]